VWAVPSWMEGVRYGQFAPFRARSGAGSADFPKKDGLESEL
jgi:hypothetical protein